MHFSRSAARAALVSAIVACGVSGPMPDAADSRPSSPTAVDSDDGDVADDLSTGEESGKSEQAGEPSRRGNSVILNLPGHGQIVVDVSDPQVARQIVENLRQLHVEPLPDLPASKFCVGIMIRNLTPETRSDLPPETEGGVLVQQLLPGGPAAAAGLEPQDIITHIGDKSIADPAALIAAIDEAGESPIEIRFLRKGEKQSVRLTPQLREKLLPEGKVPQAILENVAKENKELHEAILKLHQAHGKNDRHRGIEISQTGPGIFTGPGFATADDVSRLTRTIDGLTKEVHKLQTTVEQLQKQVEASEKKSP